MKKAIFAIMLIAALAASAAFGQVPRTVSYQGVLKDDTGAIVPDGDYDFTFNIYDVETGGTTLWTEDQTIHVSAGILNAVLGAVKSLTLDFDDQYWLGLAIGGGSELSPRTLLTGVPYALNARSVLGTNNVFPDSGRVGVGTTGPGRSLHVVSPDIFVMEVEGTAAGAWASLVINASGGGGTPSLEYYRDDLYLGRNWIDQLGNWRLDLGPDYILCAESGSMNVGVGITDPTQRLDVDGAVRFGNTTLGNAGTIRWSGIDFEGYDGSTWHSLTADGGSGTLPPGSAGQTLRHNGSGWVVSDLIYNDGSRVGIGTTSPLANMEVVGDNIGYHFRLSAPTGVGPALYLNAANKDWVIYGTNPAAGAGDRKFVIRDYSAATDRLVIDENGRVGIQEKNPDATLHLPGINWDLNTTEGDFKIGDDTCRLKIGVATGGLGAGTAGIRVQGGLEKLVLGAGPAEVLWIENSGIVSIGSEEQAGQLGIYRNGVPHRQMWAFADDYGGNIYLYDENGDIHTWIAAGQSGTGGNLNVFRNPGNTGFGVIGNWAGTEEPRVWVNGSSQYAGFYMDQTGTSSVQLPAGAIDRTERLDEPGYASNNAWDAVGPALTGPDIDVLTSRTITVPRDGCVLAIATAQVDVHHAYDTQSYAFFGVSDDSTAFPVCQDVMLELSQYLPSGDYTFPVTNHSLFSLTGAGSYTFYFLGQQHSGSFQIFDVQLTLVYLSSAYGTVSATAAGMRIAEEGSSAPLQSPADIEAERQESIAFNAARIERELAELRSQVERMKREMEMERQGR